MYEIDAIQHLCASRTRESLRDAEELLILNNVSLFRLGFSTNAHYLFIYPFELVDKFVVELEDVS